MKLRGYKSTLNNVILQIDSQVWHDLLKPRKRLLKESKKSTYRTKLVLPYILLFFI